jgi:hypothetical protein
LSGQNPAVWLRKAQKERMVTFGQRESLELSGRFFALQIAGDYITFNPIVHLAILNHFRSLS